MTALSFADVSEGIKATIARYTHALDDGRVDDVVTLFCADGACDMPGMGIHEGHEALRAAYTRWKPRTPQRHLVLNTVISEWNNTDATVFSDVVFLLKGEAGWAVQVVGRYHDVLRNEEGAWRFVRRTAEFS